MCLYAQISLSQRFSSVCRTKYSMCDDDKTFRHLAKIYSAFHANMSRSNEFSGGITNGAAWFVLYSFILQFSLDQKAYYHIAESGKLIYYCFKVKISQQSWLHCNKLASIDINQISPSWSTEKRGNSEKIKMLGRDVWIQSNLVTF